ncbi:MAG: class I SAM-dependent methyltransferase [Bacteroidales bacterium]|nr:class I SAM-dependent methyltransferase [Bacteroidales bacterium]
MDKNKQQMHGVADTLYIPLTARIYVSRRFPEYFYDEKSLSIEYAIPNDSIARNSNEYVQMASVARYYNLDEMAKAFMAKHGRCNVINLGAGLETAYFRLKPNEAIFYEMDFPEVIAERRRVLGEADNEILIPGDLFDLAWADGIDTSLPSLLIVSGVFQYCHEEQILRFIDEVKECFAQAELIFDATNKRGLAYANRYVRRTGNTNAMMHFSLDDGREFAAKSGTQFIAQRPFFTQTRKMLRRKLNLYSRVAMWISDEGPARSVLLHLKLH